MKFYLEHKENKEFYSNDKIIKRNNTLEESKNFGKEIYKIWGDACKKIGINLIQYGDNDNYNRIKHLLHVLSYNIQNIKNFNLNDTYDIKKIKYNILKDKIIMDEYNKGKLTKEEEKIISLIFNK